MARPGDAGAAEPGGGVPAVAGRAPRCAGRRAGVRRARCRALLQRQLVARPGWRRPVWARDGTIWPRPAAEDQPGADVGPPPHAGPAPGRRGAGVGVRVAGASAGARAGAGCCRWTSARRGVRAGTPTEVAIRAAAGGAAPDGRRRRGRVVRLRQQLRPGRASPARGWRSTRWCGCAATGSFYRRPGPYPGRGPRARKHGPPLKLPDPATHGVAGPDASRGRPDPRRGAGRRLAGRCTSRPRPTRRSRWCGSHVERLPRHAKRPKPLWLAWVGGAAAGRPAGPVALVRRRFTIEHGFRFLKHDLGWTAVRPRAPPGRRPLDLAARARPLEALARPTAGRRPAPALGTPAAPRTGSPRPRPPRLRQRCFHDSALRPAPSKRAERLPAVVRASAHPRAHASRSPADARMRGRTSGSVANIVQSPNHVERSETSHSHTGARPGDSFAGAQDDRGGQRRSAAAIPANTPIIPASTLPNRYRNARPYAPSRISWAASKV